MGRRIGKLKARAAPAPRSHTFLGKQMRQRLDSFAPRWKVETKDEKGRADDDDEARSK